MKKITVRLPENSYEIRTGSGILSQAGGWLKELGFHDKAVIVTDNNVKDLYGVPLHRSLAEAGFAVVDLVIPAGEIHKTLETACRLYEQLADSYADRSTLILALGGGVVGDLAGFVAATYMRGVPYVQVPTSLLAMVDSSIGGKTAVDHGNLKNIVGAFYQPRMVIADIATLKTLPSVELVNGLGEVIKHGAIGDVKFFNYLERNIAKAAALDAEVLEKLVLDNAAQKAGVVGRDEKEAGERMILNYGHTVGHAVEAVSGFKLKHGQAVAIGMVAENRISLRCGLLDAAGAERIRKVILKAGLPVDLPDFSNEEKARVFEALKHDKKVLGGKIKFVLLQSIGRPVIVDDISPTVIQEVLNGRAA